MTRAPAAAPTASVRAFVPLFRAARRAGWTRTVDGPGSPAWGTSRRWFKRGVGWVTVTAPAERLIALYGVEVRAVGPAGDVCLHLFAATGHPLRLVTHALIAVGLLDDDGWAGP